MGNPIFTDFFDKHTTALMGRDVTKTYGECAPDATTFAAAWDADEPQPKLLSLAERYVAINELRPGWYKEVTLAKDELCGDIVLKAGTKLGGMGHPYFTISVLCDISKRISGDIGERAFALASAWMVRYFNEPNSCLALKNKTYGATGRCRVAGHIIRALTDYSDAAPSDAVGALAEQFLFAHIQNIASQPMQDAAQGDGLEVEHWRNYQLAILLHALERAKKIAEVDTTPLVSKLRGIVEASAQCNPEGKPTGAFFYDSPEPITTPQPWTMIEGWNLGNGKGTEPWSFRYFAADAQAIVKAMNVKEHPAFLSKFLMT